MKKHPLVEASKEIEIYVLISQISDEFYVWKTGAGNLYNAYKEHVRYRKKETKGLFEHSEKESKFPKLYRLETVNETERVAFRHVVAWTKYFLEQGMTPVSYEKTIRYAHDLLPETEVIFERIKDTPIENILAENQLIVATYKKLDKSKERTPKNAVAISVSKKEYERIRLLAEKNNLSMSRYCKNMVLSGRIVKLDPPPLWEATETLDRSKELLRQLLYAYYQNGKYYPADLENIQKAVDKIIEAECKMTEAFLKYAAEATKLLPK